MGEWVDFFEKSNRSIFNSGLRSKLLIDLVLDLTPPGGKILEPGCGTGTLSLILADSGFELTALDLSEEVITYAKSRSQLRSDHVDFVQGDIAKLVDQFGENYFETVCHSGVMEHFEDDFIVKSLEQQRLVSKRVIFAIPNHRNSPSPTFFGDERFLDEAHWRGLISRAGFEKIEVIGGDSYPSWMYLLPHGMFVTPRAYWRESKNRTFNIATKLLKWRRYVSKHFIFVCN